VADDFNAGRRHRLIAAPLIELTSRLIDATINLDAFFAGRPPPDLLPALGV